MREGLEQRHVKILLVCLDEHEPEDYMNDVVPAGGYEVALSFAGEQRTYVEGVARALQSRGIRVFYDDFETVRLWGKHLSEELQRIYENGASLAVMFISREYVEKAWPRHERRALLSRAVRESDEYVLPVRFDETEVPGLPSGICYLKAADYSPAQLATMICQKIGVKPFEGKASDVPPPMMTSLAGEVAFDYSNYDGRYVIGRGVSTFETKWSKADNTRIYVYNDPNSIYGVALGHSDWTSIDQVTGAGELDYTSPHRDPAVGQIVVLRNTDGFYAAVRLLSIKDKTRGDSQDELRFEYSIQPDGTDDFTNTASN